MSSTVGPIRPGEPEHIAAAIDGADPAPPLGWTNGHDQPDGEYTPASVDELLDLEAENAATNAAFRAELDADLDVVAEGLDAPVETVSAATTAATVGLDAVVLDSIPDSTPPPLLLDRIDPEGHTVLFGAGGIGKGTLASSWIVGLVNAGHTVLILDFERHRGEWRRRVGALGDPETLGHVYHAEPTGALWQSTEAITDTIAAVGATVVVIDSIVIACAGRDVMDPGTAGLYAQAVASLGVPVLSLAHLTKQGDTRYPFGSIFWSNLARVTWSMSRESAGIVLACRKSNNYGMPPKCIVAVDWCNDRPHDLRESSYTEALGDMALEMLTDEPMTLAAITDALNDARDDDVPAIKKASVKQALRRARALQKCGYKGRGYVR